MSNRVTIESVEVKSYHIAISFSSASSIPIPFELVIIDKERHDYELIPSKDYIKQLSALDFVHICHELFENSELNIYSLHYTFLYHNSMTICHTLHRRTNNNIENYYEQILLNSQVLLVNPNKKRGENT